MNANGRPRSVRRDSFGWRTCRMPWRAAVDSVWSRRTSRDLTALVEHDIPINEATDPVIEIADHLMRVTLAVLPLANAAAPFPTTFGEENMFVRVGRMHA